MALKCTLMINGFQKHSIYFLLDNNIEILCTVDLCKIINSQQELILNIMLILKINMKQHLHPDNICIIPSRHPLHQDKISPKNI